MVLVISLWAFSVCFFTTFDFRIPHHKSWSTSGFCIGPLLFCLYINDLKDYLDNSILRILYADDLEIYAKVPTHEIERGIKLLSEAAKTVAAWAELNYLTFNALKTKAIVFGSSHTIRLFTFLALQITTYVSRYNLWARWLVLESSWTVLCFGSPRLITLPKR